MNDYIKENLKAIKTSAWVALGVSLVYALLRNTGVIAFECTAQYLNPWQYFFSCGAFLVGRYLVVFVMTFLVSYFFVKKS
ncbi:MAG: hypothetical protein WC817_04170 [Patescibacteria group bacterium]|jgi:hypothetical protein